MRKIKEFLMQNIVMKLYLIWVSLVFTVFMILFFPFMTIPFLFGYRGGSVAYFFLWLWSWIFAQLTFIRYRFEGLDHIKKNTPYIFVSNHTSYLDIPGIRLIIPSQFRVLAKKELLKLPIFGWVVRGATVVVDRSNDQSRKHSIQKLQDILLKGISILMFVEGTQNRTDKLLQPFKNGAFRIAIDTETNILPIVVMGAGKLMPPGTIKIKPGIIKIRAGAEISTKGMSLKDINQIKDITFQRMMDMLKVG